MADFVDFAIHTVNSSIASLGIVAIIGWLMRNLIAERLKASVKHEFDTQMAGVNAALKRDGDEQLARLNANFAREADKLKLSTQSFGEAQKAVFSKRLEAIEDLWGRVLRLEKSVPGVIQQLNILTADEYVGALKNPHFAAFFKQLNHVEIITTGAAESDELEKRRPFLGEHLWVIYATYQAVLYRTIYLVDCAKSEPEKLRWFDDSLVRRHISSALGEETLKLLDGAVISKLSYVQNSFRLAILRGIETVVGGDDSGKKAAEHVDNLAAQIDAARTILPQNALLGAEGKRG